MSAADTRAPVTRAAEKRRARRRSRGGWTLVEVMMSMAILVAGGAGILALQQATTDGNLEARQMTTATTIARTWVERLKRDTLLWTAGGNGITFADLSRTLFLQAVPPPSTAPVWGTPVPPDLTVESYAFDYFGADALPSAPTVTYCAQDRLQWVSAGQTIRADVRVWWFRRGAPGMRWANCGVGSETLIGNATHVHTVTTSVLLHWTRRQ